MSVPNLFYPLLAQQLRDQVADLTGKANARRALIQQELQLASLLEGMAQVLDRSQIITPAAAQEMLCLAFKPLEKADYPGAIETLKSLFPAWR